MSTVAAAKPPMTAKAMGPQKTVGAIGIMPSTVAAALIVLPYIGIFAYIITQGGGMAERNKAQAIQARDELRQVVGFSIADELLKLDRLKSEKSISDEEYLRLRARLVA